MPDHSPLDPLTPAQINPYRALRSQFADEEAHVRQQYDFPLYPLRATSILAGVLGGAQWSGLYLLLTDVAKLYIPCGFLAWPLMVVCGAYSAPFLTDIARAFDFKTLQFRFGGEDDSERDTDTLQWYAEGARRQEEAARWHAESGETPEKAGEYSQYADQWRNEAARWQQEVTRWREGHKVWRKIRARKERRVAVLAGFLGAVVVGPFLLITAGLAPHPPRVDWTVFFVEYGIAWAVLGLLARTEA